MAAIAAHRYDLLKSILLMPIFSSRHNEQKEAIESIYLYDIIPDSVGHIIFPHPEAPRVNYKTPSSQYLHKALKPLFDDIIPSDLDYTDLFDRYEYITSLVHADLYDKRGRGITFPGGCFMWRSDRSGRWLPDVVAKEVEQEGDRWPPFRAGFFNQTAGRLSVVKRQVDEIASRHRYG